MTPLQFERLKDFATRMAAFVYSTSRRPSGQWVRDAVADFFDDLTAEDMAGVRSWDQSDRRGLLCDWVTEFLDELMPPSPRCDACRPTIFGRYGEADCRCDDREFLFLNQWNEQWGDQVRCCIRAAVDVLAGESGVAGFTAGDLRKMYPEGIPDWVFDGWWPREQFAELGDAQGIWL